MNVPKDQLMPPREQVELILWEINKDWTIDSDEKVLNEFIRRVLLAWEADVRRLTNEQ